MALTGQSLSVCVFIAIIVRPNFMRNSLLQNKCIILRSSCNPSLCSAQNAAPFHENALYFPGLSELALERYISLFRALMRTQNILKQTERPLTGP